MDTGDRIKKNLAKGGARPKENSRRYHNFQPNRVFKTPDSDSSEELDVTSKSKDSFKSISSFHNHVAEGDGYTYLHKTNRKKRRARSNCDSVSNQNWQAAFCLQEDISSDLKSNESVLDHLREGILDDNSIPEIHDDTLDLKPYPMFIKCLDGRLSQSEYFSDRDRSLKYFTNPENLTKCSQSTSSNDSEIERKNATAFPRYSKSAKSSFADESIKNRIAARNSLDYNAPRMNKKDKRFKKYRRSKKATKPVLLGHSGVDQNKIVPDHYSSLNSSSPHLCVSNEHMFSTDDDASDITGTLKTWNLRRQSSNSKENKKSLKNLCQFSSSSSEADDEFECDCNFCFSTANNSRPTGIELVRSMLNERTEIDNHIFGDWLNVPPLSPTETAWDVIVQELVEQIRRFNVDIDLFSPCSAMTNSDFESLPTTVLSDRGLQDHQEIQTCTICLSVYEEGDIAKILPCLHIFHVQCIKLWLAKSSTCPVCRDVVKKKNVKK